MFHQNPVHYIYQCLYFLHGHGYKEVNGQLETEILLIQSYLSLCSLTDCLFKINRSAIIVAGRCKGCFLGLGSVEGILFVHLAEFSNQRGNALCVAERL